jgi:hypothetical protein
MRRTAGYTLSDHKRSENILKELQIEPDTTHVQNYRTNWMNHERRMKRVRISKELTTYTLRGRNAWEDLTSDGMKM